MMANPISKNPEELDYNAAFNVLFSGGCLSPGVPPEDWKAWTMPTKSIDVDQNISDLIKRSRDPRRTIKLRPREELEARHSEHFCPYFAVRGAIARAAQKALDVSRDRKSAQAFLLSEFAKEASDLSARYQAFVDKWKTAKYARLASFDGKTADGDAVDDELKKAFSGMASLRTAQNSVLNSLEKIAQSAQTARSKFAVQGSPGDAWSRQFVEQLGYGWYELTGGQPSRGPEFSSFVTNSYASLGGIHSKDFERPIRTVLKAVEARPEYDRFDRDDKVPSDKIVSYVGGRRFFAIKPTQRELDREVLQYVHQALHDREFEAMVRIERILRGDASYYKLLEPYLPDLRNLPGWREPSQG